MAVAVYLKTQHPDCESPSHHAPRWLVALLVAGLLARWIVGNKKIQLTTVENWQSIKSRFRAPNGPKVKHVAFLNPPGYHTMTLQTYPPIPKTYREKMEQERIWMTARNF